MWSMLGTLEWGQGMVFPALCVADVVHAGHPGIEASLWYRVRKISVYIAIIDHISECLCEIQQLSLLKLTL